MNVIVIMEDSFRKDHLGCYGNKWIQTPNIDKFASKATTFDYAYAEGLPTLPVRASLFTGRYTLPYRGWQPLEQKDVLLAEILWDKGVRSALISDTYHMHKPMMGFSRGFDHVTVIRGQELDRAVIDPNIQIDLTRLSELNYCPYLDAKKGRIVKDVFSQYLKNRAHWKSEDDHHIAQVISASMKWLEETVLGGKRDNLLLWVDSFDPHEPWDPPTHYTELYPVPEYDGLPIIWGGGFVKDGFGLEDVRHIRSQYAGTITMVDKWTGLFLEKVEELGLMDNTMIIFLSDHGEPLGEHGIVKKTQPWPYDELSHVPLIVRLPDDMTSRSRVNGFVGMPDIAPTILNFLGKKVPKIMQGKDILPVISGDDEGMDFGISGFYGRSWSIRDYEWSFYICSYVRTLEEGWLDLDHELYQYNPDYVPPEPAKYRLDDQAENTNILKDEFDTAKQLKKDMGNFIKNLSPSPGDVSAKKFSMRGVEDSLKAVFKPLTK